MDKVVYLINLYDYYGELLTEKQREYFEEYYFKNLTLSEISENKQISRTAIHKTIKEIENKLTHYEEVLKLYKKSRQIKEITKNLNVDVRKKIEELI